MKGQAASALPAATHNRFKCHDADSKHGSTGEVIPSIISKNMGFVAATTR